LNTDPWSASQSAFSYAMGINDLGQVVGWNQQTIAGNQSFLATADSTAPLGLLPNPRLLYSQAYDINNSGSVVGVSSTIYGGGPYAFLFSNNKLKYLGALPGDVQSVAYGLNQRDQVVGESLGPDGATAFLYSGGTLQSLGTLPGGTESSAAEINNSGQIVGYSTAADGKKHAFLYAGGSMQDLGLLSGFAESEATDISNTGQVVGALSAVDGLQHAFTVRAGVMQDLNALIAPGSGWILNDASGVNVYGQIVGTGTINGVVHAFVLTPVTAAAAQLHAPAVTDATTTVGTQTNSGLVITPNAADAAVAYFRISSITGGTLYLHDGTTPIHSGDFITAAQAAAGLRYTPSPNSTAQGSFLVQSSLTPNTAGLSPLISTAKITVTAAASALSGKSASIQALAAFFANGKLLEETLDV
jgi:probable HAF family extracellular repeat protein